MSESIAEVIYAGAPRAPQQRWLVAALLAVGIHVGMFIMALESEPTLEFWASDLATRVHSELSRLHEVPIEPTTHPHEEPLPEVRPPTADHRPPTPDHRQPKADHRPPTTEPAAAAEIIAADNVPADFTGATIVTGNASVYAGGVTTSSGTSTTAVPPGSLVGKDEPASSSAKAVEPSNSDWGCPWPAEAERAEVNEESATVRVVVGPDGVPVSVRVLRDPGFGFGSAAAACAMRERYNPALDSAGSPIRAESAPIRVTFSR